MLNRKTVCGVIAFVMFFVLLGTVGAVEQNTVPFAEGTARMFAALGLWAFFTWQSGAFDYSVRKYGREACRTCQKAL